MTTLIVPAINLFVLIALLVYLLRAPLKAFVAQRHVHIRDEVKVVRDQLQDAKLKYEEFSSKLKAIDVEVSAIRGRTQQEGEAIKSKIVSTSKQLASTILGDAKNRAGSMAGELKQQILEDIGTRVVSRSEEVLRERLTRDDRARIRKEFSGQVGSSL